MSPLDGARNRGHAGRLLVEGLGVEIVSADGRRQSDRSATLRLVSRRNNLKLLSDMMTVMRAILHAPDSETDIELPVDKDGSVHVFRDPDRDNEVVAKKDKEVVPLGVLALLLGFRLEPKRSGAKYQRGRCNSSESAPV